MMNGSALPHSLTQRHPLPSPARGLAGGLVFLGLLCAPAHAQEEASDAEDGGKVEEVVVTGIRSSLENALETKKVATEILDAISAEDIGKLPDKNIGEALQRVTGVQITREGGEGKNVNIRGVDAALNRVEFNGSKALSTDVNGGRQVDFRDFPSEMVSRLEVVKSLTADMTEGGLGGTVRIISRKPLDKGGESYFAASMQGVYSDLADSTDPRLAVFGSKSFNDNTFGLLGGVVYESRELHTHQFRSTGWTQPIDANGDGSNDYFPFIPRPVIVRDSNDRIAFNGIAQWRPTDELEVYLEGMYSQRNYDKDDQLLQVRVQSGVIDPGSVTLASDGQTAMIFDAYSTEDNNLFVEHRSLVDTFKNDIYQLATGGNWASGPWDIDTRLTYSQMNYDQIVYGPVARIDYVPRVTVNMDNKYRVPQLDFHGFDILDPNNFTNANVSIAPRQFEQSETNAKIDLDYALDRGAVTTLEWGAEYSQFKVSSFISSTNLALDGIADPSVLPAVRDAVANYTSLNPIPFFDTVNVGFQQAAWYKMGQDYIDAIGGGALQPDQSFQNTWEITESTMAGYAKMNFVLDTALPIRGNVGVRLVDTDVDSSGFSSTGESVNYSGGYTELLPSAGAIIDIVPDTVLLKAAVSSLIARPAPSDLAPRLSVDTNNLTASRGNPDIDPYQATQYDLSLEWYPGGVSFVSAAVFYKDVSSFVQTVQVEEELPGYEGLYTISQPENGGSGVVITGLELGGQFDFGDVAPALTGFGMIANFTYAQDDGTPNVSSVTGEQLPFVGLSETSYNLSGYYEDYGFSARIAYNWRDDFLITPSGRGNIPEFQEAYGQVDASVNYEFREGMSVFADFINITNSVRIENSSSELRRNYVETFGRRYFIGFRMRL